MICPINYATDQPPKRPKPAMTRVFRQWNQRCLRQAFLTLTTIALAGLGPKPAIAAERVYALFGPVGASVSIESIEHFARTGESTGDMAFYARYLDPPQLTQLRDLLNARLDVGPVAVSQFLFSPQGDSVLRQLTRVARTKSGAASDLALRGAIVLAAADPQGLTLLNVLRYYPTEELRLNLQEALAILRDLEVAVADRQMALKTVLSQTAIERDRAPLPNQAQPDLSLPGPWAVVRSERWLNDGPDATRRRFQVDFYWPKQATGALPVVVISHGLGSDRNTYRYLAQHLASYGWVVAVPDHPGSDRRFLDSLLAGEASEVSEPQEFFDRPADVNDVLALLAREGTAGLDNDKDPKRDDRHFEPVNRPEDRRFSLDLDHVAIIGQSFGGYTALALAGANLDFDHLRQSCSGDHQTFSNASLLLQCRALAVAPRNGPTLVSQRNPQIKAALAINPFTSGVFGDRGLASLAIPTAIVTGSDDPIAPAVPEQIGPFARLDRPDKWLVLLAGGTHFSTLGSTGDETIQFPPWVVGPRPDQAQRYIKAFATAFLKRYLNGDRTVEPLLSAAWAAAVSQPELPLAIVREVDPSTFPNRSDRSIP